MSKRPRSITILGWLFVAVGVVSVAYHATAFNARRPFDDDLVWVGCVRLLAILGGMCILRGRNWARWLLVVWLPSTSS